MECVLVLGSEGQLGGEFLRALAPSCRVVGADLAQVDVCRPAELGALVRRVRPDTIINCTAWNGVDQAEAQPLDALNTNAFALRPLALLAAEVDALLVHFSTDFVFDGAGSSPYSEEDQPRPLSTYGMSKYLGEIACERAPRRYVLRLSSLYGGPRRTSYIDHIARAALAGAPTPVFTDRMVSPSFATDVVDATLLLVSAGAPAGVYHCASSDFCSWFELGREIARILSVPASFLEPVPFRDTPGRAKRPRFCALSSAKLGSCIGSMPEWRDALRRYLRSGRER
jgi:dTDP-4-dehydrorhamnose reductase